MMKLSKRLLAVLLQSGQVNNMHRSSLLTRLVFGSVMVSLVWATLGQTVDSSERVHLQASHQLQTQRLTNASSLTAKEGTLGQMLADAQQCKDLPIEPLRIESVLSRVICNRLGVREGFGLTAQAQAALELAQLQNRPNFSLTAGVDAQRVTSANVSLAARMDWVLFDFGASSTAVTQARQALAAVLDDQRAELLLAIADAAQLFASAKTSFGRFDVAATNMRVADESFKMVSARYASGASNLPDKLQAQTALSQAKLEHARARAQWFAASGTQSVAMGLPSKKILVFNASESELDSMAELSADVPALIEEAKLRHPRIMAARQRLTQAQSLANTINASKWGSVNVNAVLGTGRSGATRSVFDTTSAALFWTLPLFNDAQIEARQRDAFGQIQTRDAVLDEAMKQIELEIWLQAQALSAERNVQLESAEVLKHSETFLQASSQRYRMGVGSMTDVLNAQNIAANARFQWVESNAN